MRTWVIEHIQKRHRRAAFTCGRGSLDVFLRHYARQNDRGDLGRTYVAHPSECSDGQGYYTLAAGSLAVADVPAHHLKGSAPAEIPVVLLGRLAVETSVQGRGLGKLLLMDAMKRSLDASGALAINALVVHALDTDAQGFYKKYGFHPLQDDPLHLFIAMSTIRQAFR